MILVDVYSPALNKSYDFGLEEEAQISQIIEEIVEMICQREQCSLMENGMQFALCSETDKRILPPDCTVQSCGIKTGNRLILL